MCRACRPPQQPLGIVDVDPKHMATIKGWEDDKTLKKHFYIDFWCPLCFDSTKWRDESMTVNFDYEYDAGVGSDVSRSAVCPQCKHAFVVSSGDIMYARQKVRNVKKMSYVNQKLYPCLYTHTPQFCQVPCEAPAFPNVEV